MFAGVWDACETADQSRIESFTIVDQPAGSPVNGYHDRAPVVLLAEAWRWWLDLGADVSGPLGPESRTGSTWRRPCGDAHHSDGC